MENYVHRQIFFKYFSTVTIIIVLILFTGTLSGSEPITFKLAGLKLIPVKWDKKVNFEKLEQYARKAVAAGAQFVVAGEGYLEGYVGHMKKNPGLTRERYLKIAEPINGPWIKKIGNLAAELKIWLLVGMAERRGEEVYNSAFLFSPEGKIIGSYSKSHTGGYDKERFNVPGNDFPVFETPLGKVGIVICYDRKLPETMRILAIKGAQIILVPAYGLGTHEMSEDILMRTRAYDNGVYAAHVHPKNTFIVDPEGIIIAQAKGETEEIVMATIIMDERVGQGAINSRRPSIYKEILIENK
jgi:predicted amidohydrolase